MKICLGMFVLGSSTRLSSHLSTYSSFLRYSFLAIVLRPDVWALCYAPAFLFLLAFFPHELLPLQSTRYLPLTLRALLIFSYRTNCSSRFNLRLGNIFSRISCSCGILWRVLFYFMGPGERYISVVQVPGLGTVRLPLIS